MHLVALSTCTWSRYPSENHVHLVAQTYRNLYLPDRLNGDLWKSRRSTGDRHERSL